MRGCAAHLGLGGTARLRANGNWVVKSTACAVVASAFLLAFAVQAHAAIYWNEGTQLGRVNLDGSGLEPSFIQFPSPPASVNPDACSALTLGGPYIYWIDPFNNAIGRAQRDGSDPDFTLISNVSRGACGIAVDDTHIYWTDNTTIDRANLDGSDVELGFISQKDNLFACSLVLTSSFIYWDSVDRRINRATLDGESISEPFITNPGGGCGGLALDDAYLYWANEEDSIARVGLDGSGLESHFISGLTYPNGLAINSGIIYWTRLSIGQEPAIGRANLDGSRVEPDFITFSRDFSPGGIAADDGRFTSQPLSPKPLPPSRFHFGKLKHDRRRLTAFIAVKALAAGSLRVSATRGVKWSFLPEQTTTANLATAGRKWLKLWPASNNRAGHRLRRRIKRRGKASIVIHVHYTESGHSTSVGGKRLSLIRVRPSRRATAAHAR